MLETVCQTLRHDSCCKLRLNAAKSIFNSYARNSPVTMLVRSREGRAQVENRERLPSRLPPQPRLLKGMPARDGRGGGGPPARVTASGLAQHRQLVGGPQRVAVACRATQDRVTCGGCTTTCRTTSAGNGVPAAPAAHPYHDFRIRVRPLSPDVV